MDAVLLAVKVLLVMAFLAVSLVAAVLPVVAVVSAIATPGHAWRDAGRNKFLWVLALFLFNILAAVPYWFIVRPSLRGERRVD